jgi:hypothetical protein
MHSTGRRAANRAPDFGRVSLCRSQSRSRSRFRNIQDNVGLASNRPFWMGLPTSKYFHPPSPCLYSAHLFTFPSTTPFCFWPLCTTIRIHMHLSSLCSPTSTSCDCKWEATKCKNVNNPVEASGRKVSNG